MYVYSMTLHISGVHTDSGGGADSGVATRTDSGFGRTDSGFGRTDSGFGCTDSGVGFARAPLL